MRAIALASRLHPRDRYARVLDEYRDVLSALGVDVEGPVTGPGEVSVEGLRDLLLLVFLTGGTSRLGFKLAMEARGPVALVAHGYHNSLPSALSCRARLREAGVEARLVYSTRPSELDVEDLVRAWRCVEALRSTRLALLMEDAVPPGARRLSEALGVKVVPVSRDRVLGEMQAASREEAREVAVKRLRVVEASDRLVEAVRVYLAFRRIAVSEACNAVTLDCFKFLEEAHVTPCIALALLNDDGIVAACEADYESLAAMIIARELTGRPSWMANLAGAEEGLAVLAHCTIALSIASRWNIEKHFETGLPYAIAGTLPKTACTLLRLKPGYTGVWACRGFIEQSGKLSEDRCRTQALIRLEKPASQLIQEAQGNHHIVALGDVTRELQALDWTIRNLKR